MINYDYLISEAIKTAARSSQKRFWTGAVIWNTDRLIRGWSHRSDVRLRSAFSTHAEIHCLLRSRHLDLEGSIIAIATISVKSGNVTLAKPCQVCGQALLSAEITKVLYTVSNSEYAVLDLAKVNLADLQRTAPAMGRVALVS